MNAVPAAPAAATSLGKGRPRLLFVTLLLGQASQSLAFTAFVAALPQMAHEWGARGPFLAQMTMALAALGTMLGSLVSGQILERAGTRNMLIGALLAFALSGAEPLLLGDPTLLLVARFISGFSCACIATVCLWGIAAEFEATARARVLGISSAISNVAAVVATVVGGYLAQRVGWATAFIQITAFGLFGCACTALSMRQVYPGRAPSGGAPSGFLQLLPFYITTTLLFAVMFMSSIQFAFVLEQVGVTDPARRSWYMVGVTVAGALTSLAYGQIRRLLGERGAFSASLVLMSVALIMEAEAATVAVAASGALLMGMYVGIVGPYIYDVISERNDAASRGRAIGILTAFGFLGAFLNPILAALIGDAIGLRNLFLVVGLSLAVAAVWVGANLKRWIRSLARSAI
jgi:MFS family permease